MSINNFKELEKEEMKNLDPSIDRIKSNVNKNLGIFQFLGDMFDMFLPKLASILVELTGGSTIDDDRRTRDRKYPNR